jgi:hypothetical protein
MILGKNCSTLAKSSAKDVIQSVSDDINSTKDGSRNASDNINCTSDNNHSISDGIFSASDNIFSARDGIFSTKDNSRSARDNIFSTIDNINSTIYVINSTILLCFLTILFFLSKINPPFTALINNPTNKIKCLCTKETIPAPTKILIPKLEDDTDGEGFIVSTQTDPHADYYEWQKGTGTNAADANTIPELKNFKTTKKISFVDDEVVKGVRTFYRVRAANTNCVGPWSEAVGRVQ